MFAAELTRVRTIFCWSSEKDQSQARVELEWSTTAYAWRALAESSSSAYASQTMAIRHHAAYARDNCVPQGRSGGGQPTYLLAEDRDRRAAEGDRQVRP